MAFFLRHGSSEARIARMRRSLTALGVSVATLGLACETAPEPGTARPEHEAASTGPAREIDQVLETLLVPPTIQTASGFRATVLVPPGELYDPLTMIPHGDVVWVNDDGGTGPNGRIWDVDQQGRVSVVVAADRLNASTGFDIAHLVSATTKD